jgi:hypothetical protein
MQQELPAGTGVRKTAQHSTAQLMSTTQHESSAVQYCMLMVVLQAELFWQKQVVFPPKEMV